MNLGVPKEIRDQEKRVGLTPAGVMTLVREGHNVYVETKAGIESGFTDEDYGKVGGKIVYTSEEAWGRAEMVVKVTPPLPSEYEKFVPGQIIFSFLHLAVAPSELIHNLVEKNITAIAYETVEDSNGNLCILIPMSEVAGRLSLILGGQYLQSSYGGAGILLSGVPGVPSAEVIILGGGVVGYNAVRTGLGLGAQITLLDDNIINLKRIDEAFNGRVNTVIANNFNIERAVRYANLLIGAVLVPGARAPILVTREMVRSMRKKSVIVDVSIDQGGCVETSRPTTHSNPVFVEEGVIHYCVPNIPGCVPRTATFALTNSTLPFILRIGRDGLKEVLKKEQGFRKGINFYRGKVVNRAVALAHGLTASDIEELL